MLSKAVVSEDALGKELAFLTTIVWENPNRSYIFISVKSRVLTVWSRVDLEMENPVIPQAATK